MVKMSPEFYPGPDGGVLRFGVEAFQNHRFTQETGKPVFWERVIVHVGSPGKPKSMPALILMKRDQDGNVVWTDDEKMHLYRKAFEAWSSNKGSSSLGTPLDEWPGASESFVAQCRAAGVVTLEQFIDLDDSALGNLGTGARKLQASARKWRDENSTEKVLEAERKKSAALEARLAQMEEQLEQLTAPADPPAKKPAAKA